MAFGSQITLHSLPPELLAHVVVHIENARTLFHLALTCKRMNSFIEDEGFRVFVQTRFPYLRPPPNSTCSFWKDATHGLTTLSRNWERKAFVAYTINPRSEVSDDVGRNKARAPPRQRGQTMGFVPVIDSYETWYGGEWSSRKEIVAWGAGAELIMRSKVMGDRSKNATEFPENSYMKGINSHQHNYSWTSYSENGAVDGRDDITCVNLLPQQSLVDLEQVIIGRASGGLAHLSLSPETCRSSLLAWYRTDERPVRSTAILEGSNPLLAACLSDSVVALYSISPKAGQIPPIGQLSATSSGKSRTWCSRFVSTHRLAVGFGTSRRPIHVYNIGRGELSAENLDTIGFDDSDIDGQLDMQSIENPTATSVYSLAPVAACSSAGTARGDTFMSGAYDGLARLHDLRSRKATSAIYRDPVDSFSPIYSLIPIGSERFIAGGARHSIVKVFDLRMPGDKLYHAAALDSCSNPKIKSSANLGPKKTLICCTYHHSPRYKRPDWNFFLKPEGNLSRRGTDSPVYSLSRPSPCSPTFFAGIESKVIQFDMVSIMDQHPDPIYQNGPAVADKHDIKRRWNPEGTALCLSMYEHDTGPVTLIKQGEVEHTHGSIQGWDERWKVPDMGNKGMSPRPR